MQFRAIRFMVFGVMVLFWAATAMAAGAPRVEVKAVADVSAVEPGKPFRVAVVVTPEAGWHVYWKNPGDAGLPTKVKWSLPAGFSASDLQYPLPEKFVMPGDITAYGYEGETVFVTTITPPKDAGPASNVTIKGRVSWLVCKEECVPGGKSFEVTLPVGKGEPANADVFDRANLPAEPPPAGVAVRTNSGSGLAFHIQWPEEPANVDLYPFAVSGLSVSDIQAKTTGKETTINLNIRPLAGQTVSVEDLPVLVVYTNKNGRREGFYTNVSLRSLQKH